MRVTVSVCMLWHQMMWNWIKAEKRYHTSSVKTISQSLSETVAAFVSITVMNRRFQYMSIDPGIYGSVVLSSSWCKSWFCFPEFSSDERVIILSLLSLSKHKTVDISNDQTMLEEDVWIYSHHLQACWEFVGEMSLWWLYLEKTLNWETALVFLQECHLIKCVNILYKLSMRFLHKQNYSTVKISRICSDKSKLTVLPWEKNVPKDDLLQKWSIIGWVFAHQSWFVSPKWVWSPQPIARGNFTEDYCLSMANQDSIKFFFTSFPSSFFILITCCNSVLTFKLSLCYAVWFL